MSRCGFILALWIRKHRSGQCSDGLIVLCFIWRSRWSVWPRRQRQTDSSNGLRVAPSLEQPLLNRQRWMKPAGRRPPRKQRVSCWRGSVSGEFSAAAFNEEIQDDVAQNSTASFLSCFTLLLKVEQLFPWNVYTFSSVSLIHECWIRTGLQKCETKINFHLIHTCSDITVSTVLSKQLPKSWFTEQWFFPYCCK